MDLLILVFILLSTPTDYKQQPARAELALEAERLAAMEAEERAQAERITRLRSSCPDRKFVVSAVVMLNLILR